jgi:chloramphenicol 3-O-phosphotransferase
VAPSHQPSERNYIVLRQSAGCPSPREPVTYACWVTNASDKRKRECEALLNSVLDRVRAELPLGSQVGPGLDVVEVVVSLRPLASAAATIDWIAINGDRVDVVLSSGEAQWRVTFGSSSGTTIDWLGVYSRPSQFDGFPGGRAIIVNGPSGAGKSTLMLAMQQIAAVPLVIFDEPEHIGAVKQEYLIWRDRAPTLHTGYLRAIASLARAGNIVAAPGAGHSYKEFMEAFGDVSMLRVGLTCNLNVLIERERRSGRWGGIAEESLGVHEGWTYDLNFDTTNNPDPLDLARQILHRADAANPEQTSV